MNKKIIAAFLILSFCFTTGIASAKQPEGAISEAYINIDNVWRASSKGKNQLAKIEKQVADSKQELQTIQNELRSIKEKFDNATTDDQKRELAQQLELKRREFIEKSTIKKQEIDMMRNEAQQAFVEEIIPIINKYRSDQGIMVIHRFSPNNVISVDPQLDITDEVLEIYNKQN